MAAMGYVRVIGLLLIGIVALPQLRADDPTLKSKQTFELLVVGPDR